jgi:hypothetical protein
MNIFKTFHKVFKLGLFQINFQVLWENFDYEHFPEMPGTIFPYFGKLNFTLHFRNETHISMKYRYLIGRKSAS